MVAVRKQWDIRVPRQQPQTEQPDSLVECWEGLPAPTGPLWGHASPYPWQWSGWLTAEHVCLAGDTYAIMVWCNYCACGLASPFPGKILKTRALQHIARPSEVLPIWRMPHSSAAADLSRGGDRWRRQADRKWRLGS